jgi:REP element-mobilizing transposase RayT
MLQPYEGRVYDPCCGSGGMFVQSEKFVEAHGGNRTDVSIFGQESNLVERALKHFDGERYRLLAWCVMPNHVHVVVRPNPGYELSDIAHSWKSYTANEANKMLGRTGTLWQPEPYDHLIRDDQDLEHQVGYALSNPSAAGRIDWRWVGHAPDIAAILESGTGILPVMNQSNQGQDGPATGDLPPTSDIGRIVYTYRQWRGEPAPSWWQDHPGPDENGLGPWQYRDIPGFCKSVTIADITKHGFVLTPGRYVGAEEQEDDGEPFAEKLPRLVEELEKHLSVSQC